MRAQGAERRLESEHVAHDGAAARLLEMVVMLHAMERPAHHDIGEVGRSLELRHADG